MATFMEITSPPPPQVGAGGTPWQIPGLNFTGAAPNILQIAQNFPAALAQMTPAASGGAGGLNTANQADLLQQIMGVLPTGAQSLRTLGTQADQMLQGIIPQDVQRAIRDSSAGKALMLGVSGSPAATYDQARTLGLTSLDLINRGAGLFGQATDLARRGYMPQQIQAESLIPGVADVYNSQLQQWLAMIQQQQARSALNTAQAGINQGAGMQFPGQVNYNPGNWSGINPNRGGNFMNSPWGAGGGWDGGTAGTATPGTGLQNLTNQGIMDYYGTREPTPFGSYGPLATDYQWGPGVGQSGFFGVGNPILDPFAGIGGNMDYLAGFGGGFGADNNPFAGFMGGYPDYSWGGGQGYFGGGDGFYDVGGDWYFEGE